MVSSVYVVNIATAITVLFIVFLIKKFTNVPSVKPVQKYKSFNDLIKEKADNMEKNRSNPIPDYIPPKRQIVGGSAHMYSSSANAHLGL